MSTNSSKRAQAVLTAKSSASTKPKRASVSLERQSITKTATFRDHLKLDKSTSMRRRDENGYLHVKRSPLTREQVAEYLGSELPEFPNLDPDKLYKVYRPGSELAKPKTVQSIQNIPIQFEHHQEDPRNPPNDTRVGSCGTDGAWQAPYLVNSLVFYDARAIARIEDGSMRELSLGYTCNIAHEPGKTPQGEPYDFVMRDIVANHLALVEEGRAGPNVRVLDNKPSQGVKLMDDKTQAELAELLSTAQKILNIAQSQGAAPQDEEQEPDVSDDEPMPEELEAAPEAVPEATEEENPDDLDEEEFPPADDVDLGDEEEDLKDEESDVADDEDSDSEVSDDEAEPVTDEEKQALADAGITDKTQQAYFLEFWRARPRTAKGKMKQDSKSKVAKYSHNQLERVAERRMARALGAIAVLQSNKFRAYDQAFQKSKEDAVKKSMAEMRALHQAIEDVRPLVGALKFSSFKHAGDVYLYALKKKGFRCKNLDAKMARASFIAYAKGLKTNTARQAKKADAAVKEPTGVHNLALAKALKGIL